MTTLASIGELPALPMGKSYPKKRGWLLGPVTKSKKLKFKKLGESTMNLAVVQNVSEFFVADIKPRDEAIDKQARTKRLLGLWNYASKKQTQGHRLYSKGVGYRKDYSDKLPTGDSATKRGLHQFKGNKKAAIAVSDVAQAKAAKAFKIFHKAGKSPADKKNMDHFAGNTPNVDSKKQIATWYVKNRKSLG